MRKRRLYFSCALTGLPPEHRERMIALRESLAEYFEILRFCSPDEPPEDIYHHDIHVCVETCDLLLAICNEPSTGLGWELSTSVEKLGKPTLAVAHVNARVTPIVMGAKYPHYEFSRYFSASDILAMVLDFEKRQFAMQNE